MKEYLLKGEVMGFLAEQFDFYDSRGLWDVADGIEDAREVLQKMDTYQLLDGQVVAHGQWMPAYDRIAPTYEGGQLVQHFYCSVCKKDITDRYGKYRYCPYCGAKMEE